MIPNKAYNFTRTLTGADLELWKSYAHAIASLSMAKHELKRLEKEAAEATEVFNKSPIGTEYHRLISEEVDDMVAAVKAERVVAS